MIYEVHVRGLTKNDPTLAPELQGTFAGAAQKAQYLADLGVTAIELLPITETQNDMNDTAMNNGNYWGYSGLAFFAPDRRYASDASPGGPTREFAAMVKTFHDHNIKVYMDVVYNHTGEGGSSATSTRLYSFRGFDNADYYELGADHKTPVDDTGTGGNFNTAEPAVRNLIVDSLTYWSHQMGVDGFRFDLAPVLGNTCESGCFQYDRNDPATSLSRAVTELPVRPAAGGDGVDLIAEPWGVGPGTYQLGNLPAGWAEWNGVFRDTVHRAQNKLGVVATPPSEIAKRWGGSPDLFGDDGRKPWNSINYVDCHDGFTMRDEYAYSGKNTQQPWPYGPSSGGSDDDDSWDQGGNATQQRLAARTALAFVMLSAGVPMIAGGDEMYRTEYGNNNPYNIDSPAMWLDWSNTASPNFTIFAKRMIQFRDAHPALRRAEYAQNKDVNGNGLADVAFLDATGGVTSADYMSNANNHFLAMRIDGEEAKDTVRSIYVAYNGWSGDLTATLPNTATSWHLAMDTGAALESSGNGYDPGNEPIISSKTYVVAARSVVVLIEK